MNYAKYGKLTAIILPAILLNCGGPVERESDLDPASGAPASPEQVQSFDPASIPSSGSSSATGPAQGIQCRSRGPTAGEIAAMTVHPDDALEAGGSKRPPGLVVIPVYFHNITNGNAYANGYLTDAQMDAQLAVLNNSFAGGQGGAATPFRFIKGVWAHINNSSWFSMDYGSSAETNAKQALRKGGASVLNIYTASTLGINWATFPQDYKNLPKKDGVVIHWMTVPNGPYTNYPGFEFGDTLVHEVGHWLGLWHTFQGSPSCTGPGDEVSDTPAQVFTGSFQCNVRDTCPAQPGSDPIHNYMEYTYDACRTEFTNWQTYRTDQFWTRYRMARGDINGDGISDIALTGSSGFGSIPSLLVHWPPQHSTYNPDVVDFPSFAATAGAKLVSGDFNGDGYNDIAVTGPTGWASIPVAFHNPQGEMGPDPYFVSNIDVTGQPFHQWATHSGAVAVGCDFDGDGRSDIALTSGAGWGSVPVAYSYGDGSFNIRNESIGNNFAAYAQWAGIKPVVGDYNGDNLCDIALVGNSSIPSDDGSSFSAIPVAFANGAGAKAPANTTGALGSFTVTRHAVGSFPTWAQASGAKPVAGDFNGDGKGDIVLVGGSGWNFVAFAHSAGGGYFSATSRVMTGVLKQYFPGWAALSEVKAVSGDFDGDGFYDVALTGGTNWATVPIAYGIGYSADFAVLNTDAPVFAGWAQWSGAKPIGAY